MVINGQATHGARKHAWRLQAAWAKKVPFFRNKQEENYAKKKFAKTMLLNCIMKMFLYGILTGITPGLFTSHNTTFSTVVFQKLGYLHGQ